MAAWTNGREGHEKQDRAQLKDSQVVSNSMQPFCASFTKEKLLDHDGPSWSTLVHHGPRWAILVHSPHRWEPLLHFYNKIQQIVILRLNSKELNQNPSTSRQF